MAQFRYKARSQRGEALSGTLEAGSADAVATQLLNGGITPIEIVEVKARGNWYGDFRQRLDAKEPTLDDLILFCRQMYTLTKAGIPIVRGISGLIDTTRNPLLADILKRVRGELEAGRELSLAMGQHPRVFTPLMVSMVRIGENTGQLDNAFNQLSSYLEMERDTRDRVKAALRYPMVVIIAIAIAIAVVNVFVIPAFAKVFEASKVALPWQTQLLINTSNFTVTYWKWLLALILGAFFYVRYYVNTPEGRYKWDQKKLTLPIAGSIILRATLARFARSFAMTIRSGVPLIQALTVVARAVDNTYVEERILTMRNGIERGDSLTRTAAAANLFTPLVLQMMAIGEETGAVDDMLDEVAGSYEREVDYDIKNLSAAIEPIMLGAIGVLVLILALGVFLPMWDLVGALRN